MRNTLMVLGTATLGLAASNLWFASQLHEAREQLAALRTGSMSAPTSANTRPTAATGSATTAFGAPPASLKISKPFLGADGQPDEMRARMRASMEAQIPNLRAMLEDPGKREEFLRGARSGQQRDLLGINEYLHLDADEYGRLLDLLAKQQLRYQESVYECALDPGCDPMPASGYRYAQADEQELSEFLGADKAQRLANFRDNFQERRTITQLRGELSDSLRLTDVQAEKLIDVLGEERRRIIREWEQEGGAGAGMGNMYGFVSYSNTTKTVEQFDAQAGELQRRQRERAASILNAGQLEAFTQRQKDALEIARGGWEYQAELARQAAN